MDTGRLRDLAASYRSRAKSNDNELVCKYEADMACYLEVCYCLDRGKVQAGGPRNHSCATETGRDEGSLLLAGVKFAG